MVTLMNEIEKNHITISTHKHENLYFAVGYSSNNKIIRIALPQKSLEDAINEISKYHPDYSLTNKHNDTVRKICQIYYGANLDIPLDDIELDLDIDRSPPSKTTIRTSFERDVIIQVAKIQYGQVKTYKEIAESLNTHAYRAIGTAIGNNPFPIIIPCHRVIRSDGKIGGFRGGTPMKVEILKNEGINIETAKENSRIIL
jgi:methylated-DNA-[protein]-cysteine S-methyltransferase